MTYTPAADYNGPDSFTFVANDGSTNSNVATVTITVASVNDPPDALDDAATVAEDSVANVIAVLTNDTATPDTGETLTITEVTQGTNGAVAITGGGTSLTYTPNAAFNGLDTFTYTISDGNGGSDTATVTVTVSEANDPPVAVDDAETVTEDNGANAIDVLVNDTTAPDTGETLTITAVTQGTNGGTTAFTVSAVTYTPAADFTGTDTFTYTISDGNGGSDTATVTVTVTNVNDPPDALDDPATATEDGGANAIDVLANDTAAPDTVETLTITAVTQGTNGVVALTGGGTGLTYSPNANFSGSDTFTYTISDGNGGTDTASVSVTVTSVNDLPNALDDAETVVEDSGITAIPVLANDITAPDTGETLTITAVTQGSNGGTVTFTASSVAYVPAADFTGTDTFTYTISDGNGGSDTSTVTVTVTSVNDPPVANAGVDQTVTVNDTVQLNGVGSSDVEGTALTYLWSLTPPGGSTAILSDPTIVNPTFVADQAGTYLIQLIVSDGTDASSPDAVTVTAN